MGDEATTANRPKLFTRDFAALLVANVCFGYAFSSYFLLPKFVVVALGGGPREIGYVAGLYGAAVVIFLPVMGAAVDRHGRRDYMTAGALVMAAASFGFAGVDSVGPLLYALRAAQGLAFAMAFAAGGALAVDLAPPGRLGQAIGIYGLSFLSMNAVAPASVEWTAAHSGWNAAFATAGALALVSAVLSRRIRETGLPARVGDGDGGLLAVARRPGQLLGLVVVGLVGSALNAVFSFHQPFALELGIERVSDFFVAYSLAAVTVRAGFGHLIDRWGHRPVSIGALAFYAVAVLALARLDAIPLPLLGLGMGLAHGVFFPSFNAVAVAGVGVAGRGRVMALFQAAFQVGMAAGGFGYGLLAARAGYPAVFQAASVGVVVALGLLLSGPRPAPAATPPGGPVPDR